MSRYCDNTPCQGLLAALGHYAFGHRPPKKGFYMVVAENGVESEIDLNYCPFCGTSIAWTEMNVLEKWLRPPKATSKRAGL